MLQDEFSRKFTDVKTENELIAGRTVRYHGRLLQNGESVPTIEKLVFLADLYELSLDELVGRIAFDKYARIKEYLKEFAAKDIPKDEEDDILAIVCRYLTFVERKGLSAGDKLRELEEIFLYNAE